MGSLHDNNCVGVFTCCLLQEVSSSAWKIIESGILSNWIEGELIAY